MGARMTDNWLMQFNPLPTIEQLSPPELHVHRFELPEGFAWRDVREDDVSWLAQHRHQGGVIGVITKRITLLDPRTGEEREVFDDNCGSSVWEREFLGTVFGKEPDFPTSRRDADEIIGGIVFHWTEGNFGCGCNRTIFWHKAGGEPVPDEHPCDAPYRISRPEWLAAYDKEPWIGEPRPWKAGDEGQ